MESRFPLLSCALASRRAPLLNLLRELTTGEAFRSAVFRFHGLVARGFKRRTQRRQDHALKILTFPEWEGLIRSDPGNRQSPLSDQVPEKT